MTRSIFDPTGGETERSGSTHLGPAASNISHMPPDVTDGDAGADAGADTPEGDNDRADERPQSLATDSAEVARRLGEMTETAPGASQPLDEMPPTAPNA
jgi:hypothetical protein